MLEWGSVADWVGAVAQITAAVGTVVVVLQARSTVETASRAERLEVYDNFSEKYDRIKLKINRRYLKTSGFKAGGKLDEDSVHAALDLIDLFEREFFMREENLIDDSTWRILENGVERFLRYPFIRFVWKNRAEFSDAGKFSQTFSAWIDLKLNQSKG